MARVSIIIPHYNDPAALGQCLAAVEAQAFPADDREIIVADNNSPCGLAAVQAVVGGRARIVEVAEQGAGPTRNGGVAVATAPLLAFTDCDCLPEPGWLTAGLAKLDEPGVDIVGGAMTVLVDRTWPLTPAEAFELEFAFDNRDYVLRKHFTVTANLFVRRADFDAVGGFRTGVSEDQEWCLRARASGLKIAYAAEAVVGHPARREWNELIRKWRRIVSEQYQITCELPGGRLRWISKSLLVPVSILPHAIRILRSKRLSGPARGAALSGLIRLRLWRFVESLRVAAR